MVGDEDKGWREANVSKTWGRGSLGIVPKYVLHS
jgi:hypothetical protein